MPFSHVTEARIRRRTTNASTALTALSLTMTLLIGLCAQARAQAIPLGGEFQVNTYTTGSQSYPGMSSAADGSFVIAWHSDLQDGDGLGIFGQRFDATGTPVGSEFQVNTYTTAAQSYPNVADAGDGSFVVVWESQGQDGDGFGVFGQHFDAAGNPTGGEFQANTYFTGAQSYPAVASAPDGAFVIVWEDELQDGDGWGVFGRRYDNTGNAEGPEFLVNTDTSGDQRFPGISARDGGFVVVWQSTTQLGESLGIFGRRYDATGNPVGPEFRVSGPVLSRQRFPDVSLASDGRFVVVWDSDAQDGSSYGVFGQRFDDNGDGLGEEFRVNTYTTSGQSVPVVSMTTDGGFVVAWHGNGEDPSDYGVFAQRFDANGNPAGTEFQVNTYTTSYQYGPAIASTPSGGFVVAWGSGGGDGDSYGVFGQRYDRVACGDAGGTVGVSATDALIALRTAVGSSACSLCVCDVDRSGTITAADALRLLRVSVGTGTLECSSC